MLQLPQGRQYPILTKGKKMNEVKVTVTGCAGIGKSTVAKIIHDALTEKGLTSTLTDNDGTIPRYKYHMQELNEEATINKGTSVDVKTVQCKSLSKRV
jgi:thymidylate kinase